MDKHFDKNSLKVDKLSEQAADLFASSLGELHSAEHLSPEIKRSTISTSNLADATYVSEQCFHVDAERVAVKDVYDSWCRGERELFNEFQQQSITLVSYWLYYREDKPSAIGGLYKVSGDERAYLGWFAVTPDCRATGKNAALYKGKSLSEQVLKDIELEALKRGFTTLALFTPDRADNYPAQAFYQRTGFKQIGVFELENGIRERLYEKALSFN